MFGVPLMKICCFKLENMNFEHIITYLLVEKYGGGSTIREGATIRDNTVFLKGNACRISHVSCLEMLLRKRLIGIVMNGLYCFT